MIFAWLIWLTKASIRQVVLLEVLLVPDIWDEPLCQRWCQSSVHIQSLLQKRISYHARDQRTGYSPPKNWLLIGKVLQSNLVNWKLPFWIKKLKWNFKLTVQMAKLYIHDIRRLRLHTYFKNILKSTRLAIYSISSNWFSFHLVDLAFIWKFCWHLMKIVWKHCSDWNIFNIIHSTSSELQVLYWECYL